MTSVTPHPRELPAAHLHGDGAICGGAFCQPRLRGGRRRRGQRRVVLCLLLYVRPVPPPPRRRLVQPQPRFVHLRTKGQQL